MRTTVTVFPFELFGSAGTGAGAQALGDAVREILDDTEEETRPCRADCLRGRVEVQEFAFETMAEVRGWRKTGREAARRALRAGEFHLWLGGNHLSVLPVYDELGRSDCVIQFDAHLDVYAFHDTTSELSHGNFLKHIDGPRPRVVSVGHRDLFLTPEEVNQTFEPAHSAHDVATNVERVAEHLAAAVASAGRVWIDIDADAFDPAVMPAVLQPLPFGLAGPTFLKLLDAVWSEKVVGLSVSEFAPAADLRDTGLNLLGWFVEFVLLRVHEGR